MYENIKTRPLQSPWVTVQGLSGLALLVGLAEALSTYHTPTFPSTPSQLLSSPNRSLSWEKYPINILMLTCVEPAFRETQPIPLSFPMPCRRYFHLCGQFTWDSWLFSHSKERHTGKLRLLNSVENHYEPHHTNQPFSLINVHPQLYNQQILEKKQLCET